ncbi:MAG: alpha/beta hydrolase [Acidimicrobiales bacterium]|nr:alpha/beta hydrolase [Acidimicrobiales bacterium]
MNNKQVMLDVYEQGEGIPAIYTHGWADDRTAWDGVINSLENHARNISWSLRGHGKSDAPPPGNYTRDHTLDDLARIVDISDDPVVLIGHSLGGYLSLAYALQHPDRVRALVLIAAGPGFRKEETREQWNTSVQASAKKMDIPAGSEEAALHVDSWVIDSLEDITVPVLVIVGENDKRFAASMAVFEKYLDVKASVIVPGAGHSVHKKHFRPVATAIQGFLSKI